MSDWYRDFANSGVGTTVTRRLGLPRPAVLRRYEPGGPLLAGPALVGGQGRLRGTIASVLEQAQITIVDGQTSGGGKPAAEVPLAASTKAARRAAR